MKYLYIASCEKDGGIYRFAVRDGKLFLVDKTPCDRPMYLAKEGNRMYAVLRAPFEENDESGVLSWEIEADGSLSSPQKPVTTGGTVGCHIAVCEGDIYVANYVSGSVAHIGGRVDVHEGKGTHPTRQTAPHAHSVLLSPSEKYVLSADLGLDRVFVYDRSLSLVGTVDAVAGSGPRHMVFSHDGSLLYVLNELSSTIGIYRVKEACLTYLKDVSIREKGADAPTIAAALRLSADGKRLYATGRGDDTVSVLSIDGDELSLTASYPTYGKEPRDLLLFDGERYAVVTNQFSHSLVLYRHEDAVFTKTDTFSLPSPLAALYE